MLWALLILCFLLAGSLCVSRTWWLPKRTGLVAVMYHHIGAVLPNDPQFPFTITPKMFEEHLKLLLQHGFTSIGLTELQQAAGQKNPSPKKPILLTFDDGTQDGYTHLFALLKKHRVKAVIFLITGKVGTPGYLNWEQILEMQKTGLVDFGSHGVSHQRLRNLTTPQVRQELAESKKTIQDKLGTPAHAFCYPFGSGPTKKRVRNLVFKEGYLFDFSTQKGINPWPWKPRQTIKRVFPRGGETLFDFYLQITRGKNHL